MIMPVLHEGDMLAVLPTLAANSIQAVVCDPPYHLSSIVQRFGADGAAPAQHGTDGLYARASRGFMGKTWDGGDIAFRPETWREVYRVMAPGAYLVAFGGTRTFHRLAVAIEDAGFELRDTLMWITAKGFPKSHDASKAIDKMLGAERARGAALPTIGLNKTRVEQGYRPHEVAHSFESGPPVTPEAAAWAGWGSALKPAVEPIILARKPLEGTIAANLLAHGCGALNIDGCRVPLPEGDRLHDGVQHDNAQLDTQGQGWGFRAVDRAPGLGRWPANVLHDGSDEVEAAFAAFGTKTSGKGAVKRASGAGYQPNALGQESRAAGTEMISYGDSGSPSRFFYSGKATAADRAGSHHPTCKPIALMRWLVRLVTPPGGTVLDPFAGSGTTGAAAMAENRACVLIEQDPQYCQDIRERFRRDNPLFSGKE